MGVKGPEAQTVAVNGAPCRVWKKGAGEPVGYLAGLGGLARWTPFLERLARHRRVVVPSIPGFPGASGHDQLDSQLDWVLAVHDLLHESGLVGASLIGASVGGALAADAAACFPGLCERLVLIGPLGCFDEADPVTDVFAQRPGALSALLTTDPERALEATTPDGEHDPMETRVQQARASEAAARLLWPVLDTRLAKRLPRIQVPVQLIWGAEDRVLPFSYARRFADRIGGPSETVRIDGAGHLADLDAPEAVAAAVERFLD